MKKLAKVIDKTNSSRWFESKRLDYGSLVMIDDSDVHQSEGLVGLCRVYDVNTGKELTGGRDGGMFVRRFEVLNFELPNELFEL